MGRCQACGKEKLTIFHHVVYEPSLVVELCGECHTKAHNIIRVRNSIIARHKLGKEILKKLRKKKHGEKLSFLRKMASKEGMSIPEVYRCIRFARKYPDLEEFINRNQNISWHRIANRLIWDDKNG